MSAVRRRPRRRASLSAAIGAGCVLVAVTAAAADEPSLVDPYAAGEPMPSAEEIRESVSRWEPEVSRWEPEVRSLELPEPRDLQVEDRDGDRTTVSISADVLFAFDSDELTDAARRTIDELAERVSAVDGPIAVVGHTDSVGTDAYNQDLSKRRARAVADHLRTALTGDPELTIEGRGSSEPLERESDDDPRAAARNRRVEISFEEPGAD